MTNQSKNYHPPVKAALYYERIKTYNSSRLFDSQNNCLKNTVVEKPAIAYLQTEQPAAEALETALNKSLRKSFSSVLSKIVSDELLIAASCRGITLDQWVIVPDALYALILVQEDRPDFDITSGKPRLLNAFVAGFKAATAKRINLVRNQLGSPVWQRSYQEQQVEDDFMLARLRKKNERSR